MDFKLIKEQSKTALIGSRLMYLIAILVASIITAGSFAILGPLLMFGLFLISIDLLNGKEFDYNRFLDPFRDLNHVFKMIGVYFLTAIIVAAGTILFIIPGIIFAYMYSQALYIIGENPELGIWEAMQESKRMMNGYKFNLFLFSLSFIGHFLLIIVTLGFYGFYFLPYQSVAFHNYYLHLKAKENSGRIIEDAVFVEL